MGDQYLIYYLESMIVCIVILGILLVHDLYNGDRQEMRIRFDNILLAHILYFICDGFWASIIAGAIPRTPFSVLTVNILLLFNLGLMGYTWFYYAAVITKLPIRKTRRGRLILFSPLLIVLIIVFAGLIVKPSLWITEDANITSAFNIFFVIAPIIYLIASFCFALYMSIKKENILNRNFYRFLGIYPITLILVGLFQINFLHDVSIFSYSCTIMIIIFYLIYTDDQISLDPLTHLNNRGQLMRYASQESSLHKEGMHTYLIMADVNDFKKINDTWGHAEGDRTLVLIADAMRSTAEVTEIPPFLGRYGGDEFILICYAIDGPHHEEVPKEIITKIRKELKDICQKEKLQYDISMSFGYEEIGKNDLFQDCMKRADQKLYQDKERTKKAEQPA